MPFEFGNALEENGLRAAWKIIRSLEDFKDRRNLCMMQDPKFLINLDAIPEDSKSKYSYRGILK